MFGRILQDKYHFSGVQANMPFSVAVICFALGFVVAGRIHDRTGPRFTCAVGAIIYGAGLAIAGLCGPRFWTVLLGTGVMMGLGIAFGYIGPLATAVKWFPERKGTVTGIVVGSFACGAFILGAVAKALIAHGMTIFGVFVLFGIVGGGAVLLLSLLMKVPETPPGDEAGRATGLPDGLMKSGHFWSLALAFFSGTFAGLAVTGSLEKIGMTMGAAEWWVGAGFLLWSIGNMSGRVGWGLLFERIGMRRAVVASLVFQSATIALLLLFGNYGPAFAVLAFCSGFNYGGNFVLYAAEVAHTYGAHRVGTVYSIIYVVYCASGFLSPFIMGKSFDLRQAYTLGLIIAAVVPVAGVTAFLLFYRRPWEKAPL